MRIGIYSGTFDPIHKGHATVAQSVAQSGLVDEVWLTPSPKNPLKMGVKTTASDQQRLEMARIVADSCTGVRVCDIEYSMPYPSYTYNTLCDLRDTYPEHSFRQIIGSDNWEIFDRWYAYREILDEFGVIVYPRRGFDGECIYHFNAKILLDVPMVEISSTFIRNRLADGADMREYLPEAICDYIKANNLYQPL